MGANKLLGWIRKIRFQQISTMTLIRRLMSHVMSNPAYFSKSDFSVLSHLTLSG